MAKEIRADVKENKILEMDASLLSILLKDNFSGKNLGLRMALRND